MACTSLLQYSKSCGQSINAGVGKLYMIAYSDLKTASGSTTNYTVSAGGLISTVGLQTGKKFVEVGINKNTVSLQESLTKDAGNGSMEITSNMELIISNMTPEARVFVDSVVSQPVAVLVKLKSGAFVAAGLNGFFELESLEAGSGKGGTDLNGYTLKFSGAEDELLRNVDGTIISTLIS